LPVLRKSDRPVVVDLGYGGSPITAIELRDRLIKIKPSVLVVGIERVVLKPRYLMLSPQQT
jgi:hypothetical protein